MTSSAALESVQRSVRTVDAAIWDRQRTIEDLTTRISAIRMSTPRSVRASSARAFSPAASPAPETTISDDVRAEVDAAVRREVARKDRTSRYDDMRSARVIRQEESANAIHIGDLPLPGDHELDIEVDDFVKVDMKPDITGTKEAAPESLVPTPAITPSTPTFGGVTFSLDAGDVGPSHSRSRGSSARTHAPAAKLSSSPTSSSSQPAPFSFIPPSATDTKPRDSSPHPPGFFSLSGYGTK